MLVISKPLFYETINNQIKCDSVHYWSKSCVKSNAFISGYVFLGSLKFFLPIYIIKAIINRKKLKDKQFLFRLIMEELRSGVYGLTMANLYLGSICILCKMSGRIHYYHLGLLCGMISGLSVLVETKENRTLDTLIFFNVLIDAIFRNMDYFDFLKLTSFKETLIFMAVSGLLMHILQNRKHNIKYTNFWFYTPQKFTEDNFEATNLRLEQKCSHKESCTEFSLKGAEKFFLLGYSFSIMRKLIPKMLTIYNKPRETLGILINRDNVKFGMFIGTYVGLYRYIICYLLKSKGIDRKYYGAIAGLVSGATYSISPSLQILTVGITTLCQILYNHILKTFRVKNQTVPELMVYLVSHGLLFHNAVMCKKTCPPYYINMLDQCSNYLFRDVYKAIIIKFFSIPH